MPTNKMILIVGGAGYIGSHMTLVAKQAGYIPLVLDNLVTGHRHAVLDAHFIQGDIQDVDLLDAIFTKYPIAAVMHFASFIQVGESVQYPGKYYQNNVAATLVLLQAMLKHKINHFIFSSSAAVYGEPRYTPIDENHIIAPINPYGKSKWMVEEILHDFAVSDQLKFSILRYFNAAGAHPDGRVTECHEPETHLIPLVLEVVRGKREAIQVFGNDYETADGTCVRDYVHVNDICAAHLLALEQLWQGRKSSIYNLGNGNGYSVLQVIQAAEKISQCKIPIVMQPRRPGDPAILVADATRALQELNWKPAYPNLETIITHAQNAQSVIPA